LLHYPRCMATRRARKRDLWIDFNDVGPDSHVLTLLRYASPGADVRVGAQVVVGDDEGNRCDAQVLGVKGEVVRLAIDGNSFRRPRRVHRPAGVPV